MILVEEVSFHKIDSIEKIYIAEHNFRNPNGPVGDEPFPRFSENDHRFLIINETDTMGFHCRDTWKDNSLELI
jgi:hypothetical protein